MIDDIYTDDIYIYKHAVCHLNEAHANSAHLGELVDGLKAMVDRLCQQFSKFLVVEDLQAAGAGNFTHSGGVKAVVEITVTTLDEDAAVTQTLGIHLSTNVIQVDTWRGAQKGVRNW